VRIWGSHPGIEIENLRIVMGTPLRELSRTWHQLLHRLQSSSISFWNNQESSLPCPQKPAISSYPEPDKSSPNLPLYLWSSLITYHLRLGLPNVLFLSALHSYFQFSTARLSTHFSSSPLHATCLVHLTLLDFISLINRNRYTLAIFSC
jgi:hypothetical protein